MTWILVTLKPGQQMLLNGEQVLKVYPEEHGSTIYQQLGVYFHVSESLEELAEMLGAVGIKRCPRCGKKHWSPLPAQTVLREIDTLCTECFEAQNKQSEAGKEEA